MSTNDDHDDHDAPDEWDEETAALGSLQDVPPLPGDTDRPVLLVLSGSRCGESIEVVDGLLVGRGGRASCRIQDPGISRVHARVARQPDGSFAVVDMGSRNGTRVNGKKMRSAILKDGDLILIGTATLLRFSVSGSAAVSGEPPDDLDDRRAHRRLGVVVKIEYPRIEDFLEDYSINISQGGMRICTTQRLEVGDELQMRLSLPGIMEAVQVRGTVRWVRQDEGTTETTAGVKIDRDDEKSRSALDELVNRTVSGPPAAQPPRQNMRVLVADDNPVVIELVRAGLKRQLRRQPQPIEVETIHAGDGQRALELLAREQFDLLIVEAELPVLDGEALIQRVRADPRWADLLIAAVSRGGDRFRSPLLHAGADFFFCKPLRLVDLLQTVQGFLADNDI